MHHNKRSCKNIHSINPLYCIIDKADDFTAGNPNGKETMLK